MIACVCGGIGEALVALYLGGSLVVGWVIGKIWKRRNNEHTNANSENDSQP